MFFADFMNKPINNIFKTNLKKNKFKALARFQTFHCNNNINMNIIFVYVKCIFHLLYILTFRILIRESCFYLTVE